MQNFITMENREKIHDAQDFYLSTVHSSELSQSSGVISLPSANKLADLSLTSDLTDSEVENEPTVLATSVSGDQNCSIDIQFEKDKKIPYNFFMKSNALPYSQSLVHSQKLHRIPIDWQSDEGLPAITNERTRHDNKPSNGESSKDFHPNKIVTECKDINDMPNVPLDDVKIALQQNCNMLSDRHLLKDLLMSLDDKIEQELTDCLNVQHQCLDKNQESIPSQKDSLDKNLKENSKPLASDLSITSCLSSPSSNFVKNRNFNKGKRTINANEFPVNSQIDMSDRRSCGTSQESYSAFFNSSPIDHKVLQKYPSKTSTHQGLEKHVQFQSTTTKIQVPLIQNDDKECEDNQKLLGGSQRSSEILKKLAGLRWGLMGWEDVSSPPPVGTSSSITFLNYLLRSFQTLQLENKHLNEELATTTKKLNDLRKDCVIKQHMYDRRETRLIEADEQLGELQQAWAAAQEARQQEAAKLMGHCHVLEKENTFLKKEGQSFRNDIAELKAISQQHTLMKSQLLDMEELLAASKKKETEVMEENNRINLSLEDNKKHVRELEEVKLPHVLTELQSVKGRAEELENSNRQLCEAKTQLEEDLHMLQEQHHLLLKKTVEEQEKKTDAEKRKSALEEELKALSGKVTTMKTQLHLHYQTQVEDLVAKKSTALQEQLKKLESALQRSHDEQMNAQVESHKVACEGLHKRYEEEIRSMKSLYEIQLEKMHCEMKKLEQENRRLHQQRQSVISAVSSVLGLEHQTSSRCWTPTGPDNNRQARSACSPLDIVKDGSVKANNCSSSGKNDGNLPPLTFQSSSSSDSDSTPFHEGKQTVRHFDDHSQCILASGTISQNNNHKKQKTTPIGSLDHDENTKGEDCGEYQSQSVMYMKVNHPRTQVTSYMYPRTEECSHSNYKLKQSYKDKKSVDNEKCVYPLIRKIRKASEILQGSDLTDDDDDDINHGGENLLFKLEENEEMARILKELKMHVSLSTVTPQSEAPTHDTSFDQDPASLTLHRLSQVSSVLSQYVNNS